MDWWHFGALLNDNIPLYLWILLGSVLLYYFIYRKMFISILDPVIFTIIFSVFGFSVVIFLFFTKSIDTKYLINYLLTQFAFIGGFFTYKHLRKDQILSPIKYITIQNQNHLLKCIFLVCTFSYIFVQLLSYKVIGIPLLLKNHIDIYSGAGGWGILGRFIDVVKPVSVFLLIYYLFHSGSSFFLYVYKYFFLIILLVFFALSGSRSEFMTLGLILFCYIILNGNELHSYFKNIRKFEIVILSLGISFVFFTIFFQSNDQDGGATGLEIFLFRLVASGDVYYFAYPNNNIEFLNSSHSFLALFGDIFSTLRIVPRSDQPIVLGFQLFQVFGDSDVVAGPNARHNVFGYVYYGFYGSIIFSYLIGLTLGFCRNKSFHILRRNVLGQALFVILYTNISVIESDPQMVVSNLENVLLMLPIILGMSFCSFILTTNLTTKVLPVYE